MALREPIPPPVTPEDIKGTVWEGLAQLAGGQQKRPFQIDAPGQFDNPQLFAGEKRVISYRGSGEILLYNIDLPLGVSLALSLDGTVRKYSPGNESGVLRWSFGESPLKFQSLLEITIINSTGSGQKFKVHISGV